MSNLSCILFFLGGLLGEHKEHVENKQADEHRECTGVVRVGGGQETNERETQLETRSR